MEARRSNSKIRPAVEALLGSQSVEAPKKEPSFDEPISPKFGPGASISFESEQNHEKVNHDL